MILDCAGLEEEEDDDDDEAAGLDSARSRDRKSVS